MSRKTKLSSLKNEKRIEKKKAWRAKMLAQDRQKRFAERMEKDTARKIRHVEHLKACAAKALKKAERIEAQLIA